MTIFMKKMFIFSGLMSLALFCEASEFMHSEDNYITKTYVKTVGSETFAYIQTADQDGIVNKLTGMVKQGDAQQRSCTVTVDGDAYSIKLLMAPGQAGAVKEGADSLLAMLKIAQQEHLPVKFFVSIPTDGSPHDTLTSSLPYINDCGSSDVSTIQFAVLM